MKAKQTETERRVSSVSVAGPGLGPSHLGLESEVIAISTWPLAGDTCKPQKELLEECLFLNQMSAALVLIL